MSEERPQVDKEKIMSRDNAEVIKAFLQEMADQNNRCTALPIFYVIRTRVSDPAPVENCDSVKWYWQDGSYDSLEEIESYCQASGFTEEEIKSAKAEAVEFGIRNRWEKKGMFLTESEAEEHLRVNHYHYSHDAHTYVEHAWRAPKLAEFISALMSHFEISSLKKEV